MTKIAVVKVYGNPKALALTVVILFGFVGSALYFTNQKRKTEYYTIQFDNVDRLTEGNKIFLKELEVGQVKDLRLDDQNKVIATILVSKDIELTKGSTFTIKSDIFGTRHIEIEPSENTELINPKETQQGYIATIDTTDFHKLTLQEYDSIIRANPGAAIADTILKTLREVYKDKKKSN